MTDRTDQEGTPAPMTTQQAPAEPTYTIENPPPLPTAEEIAERHARVEAEAQERREREEREEAQARAAAKARLEAIANRLLAEHSDLGQTADDNEEGWDDLTAHRARHRTAIWRDDIVANHMQTLAAWRLSDVEDTKARMILEHFVAQLGPDAIKLHAIVSGSIGAGKTSTAIAAGHAAVQRGFLTRFVKQSRYLAMLQPGGQPSGMTKDQVRERYRRLTQVLILDDLGAEEDPEKPASEFTRKEVLDLITDRSHAGLATIITTNLTSEQVKVVFGPRVLSRVGADAVGVKLTGQDRRNPLSW